MIRRKLMEKWNRYPCAYTKEIEQSKVFADIDETRMFYVLCNQFEIDKLKPADQLLVVRAVFCALKIYRLEQQSMIDFSAQKKTTTNKEIREETKTMLECLREANLTSRQESENLSNQNAKEILKSIFRNDNGENEKQTTKKLVG